LLNLIEIIEVLGKISDMFTICYKRDLMKLALRCDSLLIQKTLMSYLKGHIVEYEDAELIISDKLFASNAPIFLLSSKNRSHLQMPFTKAELFWALESFYIGMIEPKVSLAEAELIAPFIEKLNKKHHNKIAKLARKIS
jgi:hypothetical protein